MKNLFKLFGIIALIAIIGFTFTACDDSKNDDSTSDGSTGGNENFVSVGNNLVGGKIYYVYEMKIEFDVSTGTNGKYTLYEAQYKALDDNGKYNMDIDEVGTYIWNEYEKTLTIRPDKIRRGKKLMTKAEFKISFTAEMNEYFASKKQQEGWTQAQLDAYIKKTYGYSSITQYIDAYLDARFKNRPYTYSLSNDGKSLFMLSHLPQSKGNDELAGKTYVVYMNDVFGEYVFGANKTYTCTLIGYMDNHNTETGTYSYDNTEKGVYLSRVTINGKTAAEYYETVNVDDERNHFIDDDAYKASVTNRMFNYYYCGYEPTEKHIWLEH